MLGAVAITIGSSILFAAQYGLDSKRILGYRAKFPSRSVDLNIGLPPFEVRVVERLKNAMLPGTAADRLDSATRSVDFTQLQQKQTPQEVDQVLEPALAQQEKNMSANQTTALEMPVKKPDAVGDTTSNAPVPTEPPPTPLPVPTEKMEQPRFHSDTAVWPKLTGYKNSFALCSSKDRTTLLKYRTPAEIPLLSVSLAVDPKNWLQRMLESVDTHVGRILVQIGNEDSDIVEGIMKQIKNAWDKNREYLDCKMEVIHLDVNPGCSPGMNIGKAIPTLFL